MLDNFRKVGVVWNHSTNQIYQRMRVASSDDHGRKLVVQVTNDSVLENTQEVELRLYWEIRDKKGFNDFELIDAEHGIYEIYFSRGMLENKGTHKAWLHATDTTGSITSEAFGIEVFKGIDLEAVEGTDDFSALNSALVRVVAIESQEQQRIDNEITRQRQENDRVDAESQRESTFGDNLVSWNSQYSDAEDARDNQYSTAEDNRDSQYNQAESARDDSYQTAEQDRENDYENRAGQLESTYAPRLTGAESNISNLTSLVGEGGIVESGSGSDGSYTKFKNGLLLVRKKFPAESLTTKETESHRWDYPYRFVEEPEVFVQAWRTGGYTINSHVTHIANNYAVFNLSSTSESISSGASIFAIGRWK